MDWFSKHPANVLATFFSPILTIFSSAERWQVWWIFLLLLVFCLYWLLVSWITTPSDSNTSPVAPATVQTPTRMPARESRWMPCVYCGGTGKILAYWDRRQRQIDVCGICRGHGNYLTDRWSQPDCNYCCGSGKVLSFRNRRQKVIAASS